MACRENQVRARLSRIALTKEQRKQLDAIPMEALSSYWHKRRVVLRETLGKYAAHKKLSRCPVCKGGPFGVRELARHKKVCEK